MELNIPIQYLSNEKGTKTAVLIPYEEWKVLKKDYIKLRQYQALKNELKEGFLDIKKIEKGKSKEVTLSEFLNGC